MANKNHITEKRVLKIKAVSKHGKPFERKVQEFSLQMVISDDEIGDKLLIFIGKDRKIHIKNSTTNEIIY